jgi:hypothetical protein
MVLIYKFHISCAVVLIHPRRPALLDSLQGRLGKLG